MSSTVPERTLPGLNRRRSVFFDEDEYHAKVLSMPVDVSEEEWDERLAQEAQELGLMPAQVPSDNDGIALSLSAITLSSDPNKQSSIISQSTAPTSCSSSERRPPTHTSQKSEKTPPPSTNPSILSEIEKKRENGFKKGIRKMAGFRKRRSLATSSSTLTSITSDTANTTNSDRMSIKSGLKSPSMKSSKSSWSNPPSATKSSYEDQIPIPVDHEAVKRSMDCKEIQALRSRHLDERGRFLEYQRTVLSQLRSHHQSMKQQRLDAHIKVIHEASEKNYKQIEELEARQLEEEMKFVKEFDIEKRAVMVRLRHMEAYCQNPTPPPTPVDPETGRPSLEQRLPERKVTDKDYHNLAQQYRERDAMDGLHAAKINVLRGKQKKAVENFTLKKDREIEALEQQHDKELCVLDKESAKEEDAVRMAFSSKRARLESRWRLQTLIERGRIEKTTDLKHGALPDVLVIEDVGSKMNSNENGHSG